MSLFTRHVMHLNQLGARVSLQVSLNAFSLGQVRLRIDFSKSGTDRHVLSVLGIENLM